MLIIFTRRKISADRFIDGGAPILAAAMIKSHIERIGEENIRPFAIAILRVLVTSYIELAIEKSPEEANPCAIIIMMVPERAQVEDSKILKIIKAMWATEA